MIKVTSLAYHALLCAPIEHPTPFNSLISKHEMEKAVDLWQSTTVQSILCNPRRLPLSAREDVGE